MYICIYIYIYKKGNQIQIKILKCIHIVDLYIHPPNKEGLPDTWPYLPDF